MTEVGFRDDLRPGGVEERPLAYLGMLLTMAVVATFYAAMYFAYIYLRVGHVAWPPEGFSPPPLDYAAWSAVALGASAAPIWWAKRREIAGAVAGMRLGLALGLGLGAVHLALLQADWARAGIGVSEHAYASLFFVLPGIHASMVALAWIMAATLLMLTFKSAPLWPERHIGMRSLALFWYVLVAGGLGILAMVYLVPHVWQTAQIGS